ncbi:hypothetical protein [Roseobacter litoralis]|uniref:Uncharacterized protein n=1 Tax=Roseobacter litoralis (strain ATCC 49566 / DSM 6996 / JCM 21268 / NBRC 15278 / OCh 149) TaxID=391595 RepID=F7ZBK6_ROSLO|nr:hypothetical protein [Roseobacter litoralis]AEI95588.1 hypothetical protein RLO149_c036660 [Roseobacter litoralis Och 149]
MQLSDALIIAEQIVEDAEAEGFANTADAMRLLLRDMALCERVSNATKSQTASLSLSYNPLS